MKTSGLLLIGSLLIGSGLAPASAQPAPVGPVGLKLTPVLETATTITGQPIRFPQGDNQFTAVMAEVAPGGRWVVTCIRFRCSSTCSRGRSRSRWMDTARTPSAPAKASPR